MNTLTSALHISQASPAAKEPRQQRENEIYKVRKLSTHVDPDSRRFAKKRQKGYKYISEYKLLFKIIIFSYKSHLRLMYNNKHYLK